MAGGRSDAAAEFASLVQADRQKRKAEKIADQVFGRKSATRGRDKTGGGSLASRIGVNKVSRRPKRELFPGWAHTPGEPRHPKMSRFKSSPTNTSPQRSASAAPKILPSRGGNQGALRGNLANRRTTSSSRFERGDRLSASLSKESFANGTSTHFNARSNTSQLGQINIRGIANSANGPHIVMASNFAPGTTAADIESIMAPIAGELRSCRILSPKPTVLAEIEVGSRDGAENVVNTFNNQIADGRILYVYIKHGGPTPIMIKGQQASVPPEQPAQPAQPAEVPPQAPSGDMDVEMDVEPRESYKDTQEGRLTNEEHFVDNSPRDNNVYQDGRYGLADQIEERGRETRRYAEDDRRYDDRMRDDRGREYERYSRGGGGWGGRGYGRGGRGRGPGGWGRGR